MVAITFGTLLAGLAMLGFGTELPAQADTAPPDSGTPTTVSSDALPTVQINGGCGAHRRFRCVGGRRSGDRWGLSGA